MELFVGQTSKKSSIQAVQVQAKWGFFYVEFTYVCQRGYPIIDCETWNRAWRVMTDPPSYFSAELSGL